MVVDYKDVFGGPPTKASLHEAKYSGNYEMDPTAAQINRSRAKELINPYEDFFDDIFKLNYESTIYKRRDNIYSSPTNEKLGFSRSLLFEVDNHQLGSFVPAPYSFVSRLRKSGELPAFGTGSLLGRKDVNAKVFRNPMMKIRDILESGIHSRNYPLKEPSSKIGESFRSIKSDVSAKGSKSDRWLFASDPEVSEAHSGSNRFHFSIYNWAKKGITSSIIPQSGNESSSKDKGKIDRCSSFSGWLHGEKARKRLPRGTSKDRDLPSLTSDSFSFFDFVKDLDMERSDASKSSEKALAAKRASIFQSETHDLNIRKGDVSSTMRPSSGKSENGGKVKEFIKFFSQPLTSKGELALKTKERYPIEESSSLKTVSQPTSRSSFLQYDRKFKSKHLSTAAPSATDTSGGVSENDSDNSQFAVEELSEEEGKVSEETKAINEKVERWSKGKEGNIRSLLSTLQYVLWAESGWKAVPLVDIIEGNAVRKTYQKALLCVHPDKLQQKGVLNSQKLLAQKVHGILQDAWTYFSAQSTLL